MKNLMYDIDELYRELSARARDEGAYTKEAWDDLAEGLLEEKREVQEMDDDQAWKFALEALSSRFGEFSAGVEKM